MFILRIFEFDLQANYMRNAVYRQPAVKFLTFKQAAAKVGAI